MISKDAKRLSTLCLALGLWWGIPTPATYGQGAGTIVRTYSAPELPADQTATRIQELFPGPQNPVEVRLDARSGRVMVRASAAQHEKIAQTVQQLRTTATAAQQASRRQAMMRDNQVRPVQATLQLEPEPTPAAAAATPQGEISSGLHQLQHVNWRQLVSSFRAWLGPQLVIQGDNEVEHYWFTVKTPEGDVRFDIEGKIGLLTLSGPQASQQRWLEAIRLIDQPAEGADADVRFVAMKSGSSDDVSRAVMLLKAQQNKATQGAANVQGPKLSVPLTQFVGPNPQIAVAQLPGQDEELEEDPNETGDVPPNQPPATQIMEDQGAIGPVRIELLPGLDAIIVRGSAKDVERVVQLINEIETLSAGTEPEIQIYELKHTNSEAMAALVSTVNSQVLSTRLGVVSITPLVKPNSLLLVGRQEAVQTTIKLIERLDTPVDAASEVRVFRLRHLPAADAQRTVINAYPQAQAPVGLAPRVRAVADFRSNSLIVFARSRDLAEVESLLKELDVEVGGPENEVRVFQLRNALAEELAQTLEQTLRGDLNNQQQGGLGGLGGAGGGGGFGGAGGAGAAGAAGGTQQVQTQSLPRSTTLSLTVIDAQGKKVLNTGFLTEVRVAPDARANSLVITAPAKAMDLIAELVRQLDQPTEAAAAIKVFPIVRGNATALVTMLQTLFQQTGQGQGQLAQQAVGGAGESTLVPLRFSVDQRTNSIIATGNAEDLQVVYSILLRLDAGEVRQRRSQIYRLQNAPAQDIANAINTYLQTDRQLTTTLTPDAVSAFELLEREVVVVAETITNSLIISATDEYFERVMRLIRELDKRDPMVIIQVLIAEVTLNNTEEFGTEFGIQDSLLFDRGVAGTTAVPGYNFNNAALGNANINNREPLGGQALSNFAVGRTNGQLGYGGLVLSASNESISVLLRALQESRRLDVLSRPQITAMNNQPAYVQVGADVPQITNTQLTQFGTVNSVTYRPVGVLLGVQPRISQDDVVVMRIQASKSEVGPEAEGIPISVSSDGAVIRAPQIRNTLAETVVYARDGQTVILGGLITKNRARTERKLPYVSDIPLVGNLFRYDLYSEARTELLIIMTPFIVKNDQEIQDFNVMEAERMSWCMADVVKLHHDFLSGVNPHDAVGSPAGEVLYPNLPPGEIVPGNGSVQELLPPGAQILDIQPMAPGSSGVPTPAGPPQSVPTPAPNLGVPSGVNRAPAPTPLDNGQTNPQPLPTTPGEPGQAVPIETAPLQGPEIIQQANSLPTSYNPQQGAVRPTSWQAGSSTTGANGATVTEYTIKEGAPTEESKKSSRWRIPTPKWPGKKAE